MLHDSRRLIHWQRVIARSARSLGGDGDLIGVGWVSAMARGVPEGARSAQAAFLAALRAAR